MGLEQNPLISSTPFPQFDRIEPGHILPALEKVLTDNRARLKKLLADKPDDWQSLVATLEAMDDQLDRLWSPVSHLNGVADSPELRQAYEKALPLLSAYSTEMGQNPQLFAAFNTLENSQAAHGFTPAQKNYLAQSLRDFRLSGVDLPQAEKAQYKKISEQLSSLSNQFSRNVLDATDHWQLLITNAAELEGLPDSVKDAALIEEGGDRKWIFTLHAPSFIPLMTYCAHRPHRQAMYSAYVTRASDQGPDAGKWDNSALMQQILALRAQKAGLLGFDHYAEYSLATKMAGSVGEIETFLLTLAEKSRVSAERDLAELRERAALDGIDLQAWDTAYYSEKLKQEKFDFSEESLRAYFPLEKVLDGLFSIVETLFGIQVTPAEAPSVYHADVQFFRIIDTKDDTLRGHFYLDVFAREGKQGGAWMADCQGRRLTTSGVQHPSAFLTCNFPPPVDGKPSLLRHDDVVTLFHEFGHGLHHLLTQVDVAGVAGINGVPWDAVELPSQFLENWCWQRQGLDLVSAHYETGAPLPDALLDKMLAAKNFQSGLQMLRQVEFALFDLRLHGTPPPDSVAGIQAALDQVRGEVAVVPTPEFNRFAHAFSHIFAGGYAAGYYSYKWAEVLSADAFSRFEAEGVMSPAVGRDFLHHILEQGGSEPPLELFQRFRSRAPRVDALLRHSGLLDSPLD